ncbi:MAG: hypothetical protein K0U78_01000 [Actinomycetia bacterium]|nr:hypothetical protein [Actinomycetes bacterium]
MSLHVRRADGSRFESKEALQKAVEADEPITIIDTSPTGRRGRLLFTDLTASDVIAGFDQRMNRTWYATYRHGKIE